MRSRDIYAVTGFAVVYVLIGVFLQQPEAAGLRVIWLIITGAIGAFLFSGWRKLAPAAWGIAALAIAIWGWWPTLHGHH